MTAGNHWSGSSQPLPQPPVLPSINNTSLPDHNGDQPGSHLPRFQPHRRHLEPYPTGRNDLYGSATSSAPSHQHAASDYAAGRSPLSLSKPLDSTGAGNINLPSLDDATSYAYRPFSDRQLPPFGIRHINDATRSFALPPLSHQGIGGSSDPRSSFPDPHASSSSSMARLVGTGPEERVARQTQDDIASYRAQSQSNPFDHVQPRPRAGTGPGSSHGHGHGDNSHFGIPSRLSDRYRNHAQGLHPTRAPQQLDQRSRRDGALLGLGHQSQDQNQNALALISPRDSESSLNPSQNLGGYETELKRKRLAEDHPYHASSSRTRLPSLSGLSMPSLPQPPGFSSNPKGRSSSPAASPSSYRHHLQYELHRDTPRTGFHLVADDPGDIDQLDMDVDGAEDAPGETGKNKEDARKEKNRDKQRRLRMRRANQLQSLESTVGAQEDQIRRMSLRIHDVEDKSRQTKAVFSEWVDALEKRLRELGEPESSIEGLRNRYIGLVNAYDMEQGPDTKYRGGSKSASSSTRISFSKETSDAASTAQYTDRLAPIDTRNLGMLSNDNGNDPAVSPTAISSLVNPFERRSSTETLNSALLGLNGGAKFTPWNQSQRLPDAWFRTDLPQPPQPPFSSSSKHTTAGDVRRKSPGERDSVAPSTRGGHVEHEHDTYTVQYLAKSQEDEVSKLSESQTVEIARVLLQHRHLDRSLGIDSTGNETTERLEPPPPWRDDYTSAQVVLLCRALGCHSEQAFGIKDQYETQRLDTLTEHEKEVYKNWIQQPDRDRRIELLTDPVLRIRFIMHQKATSKGTSLVAFMSDLLHESIIFGPTWLTHLYEMSDSFLRRWADIWPSDLVKEEYAQLRRRGGHTGATAFQIILGSEPSKARQEATEVDLFAFSSTSS